MTSASSSEDSAPEGVSGRCPHCGSDLDPAARFCDECGERVDAAPAANPWVPPGALDAAEAPAAPVAAATAAAPDAGRPARGGRPAAYRWHPVGGVLAVLAGVAVIAGTFLGLFSLSVNGVRSPTVTVWRAGDTMAVPAVVERGSGGHRRAEVSASVTRKERLRAPKASLFTLDPAPGQDRWILLVAGVVAIAVGSTAILRSRLLWRFLLLLDGLLVGVITARYLVGVTRNVIDHYRGPADLTLNLSFRTNVGPGMVVLFAASAALVVAAFVAAFRRPVHRLFH